MNYIKEAEEYLNHYKDLCVSLKNMDKEIERLMYEAGPKPIRSVKYDITGVAGTYQQDEAVNVLFKLQTFISNREKTKKELEKIDKVLEEISKDKDCEFYGLVLKKWYIEKVPKEDIALEIGYSSRQSIYSLKGKAIRKFAISLFGIEGLKMDSKLENI